MRIIGSRQPIANMRFQIKDFITEWNSWSSNAVESCPNRGLIANIGIDFESIEEFNAFVDFVNYTKGKEEVFRKENANE